MANSIRRVIDSASVRFDRLRELEVHWFDAWEPSLDEALQSLDEPGVDYPLDLYRLLFETRGRAERRVALVCEHGSPLAIVGLRADIHRRWELITNWVVPGLPFPAAKGRVLDAIDALGLETRVAWWRVDEPPPQGPQVLRSVRRPTHRVNPAEASELVWTKSHRKSIRRARNYTSDLTLEINGPGAAEWVTRQWEQRWREPGEPEDLALPDRIAAARYLTSLDRYLTIRLLDGGQPVGGETLLRHGDALVWQISFRNPAYEKQRIGTRLMDAGFEWAIDHDIELVDVGSTFEYKQHWAPVVGELWEFDVVPAHYRMLSRAASTIRGVRGRLAR